MPTASMAKRSELPLLSECCSPVVREVIRLSEAETLADGFKARRPDSTPAHFTRRRPRGCRGLCMRADRSGRSLTANRLSPSQDLG
jgi:hypothetical protein